MTIYLYTWMHALDEVPEELPVRGVLIAKQERESDAHSVVVRGVAVAREERELAKAELT